MAATEAVTRDWDGATCVVAAPGPSLRPAVADTVLRASQLRGVRVLAVQDAYRLLPWADALYGCDTRWWHVHQGCASFPGEKWSSHDKDGNDKRAAARAYGLRLVAGEPGDEFSANPSVIRYGSNSGFQAINLAILLGASRIVLVGFNMQGAHFFGAHPPPLRNGNPRRFIPNFERAAKSLPQGVTILNATPRSALTCFPRVSLEEALGVAAEAAA